MPAGVAEALRVFDGMTAIVTGACVLATELQDGGLMVELPLRITGGLPCRKDYAKTLMRLGS
jgi:hypothetical protein